MTSLCRIYALVRRKSSFRCQTDSKSFWTVCPLLLQGIAILISVPHSFDTFIEIQRKIHAKCGVRMHSMSDEAIDVFVCLNMGSKRERERKNDRKTTKQQILRLPIECGRSIWLFTCYILQMNSSTQFLANMWLLRTCNPTYWVMLRQIMRCIG